MKEATVKNLQATLKHNGFYDGEVDGVWGNMSQAAFYAMVEAANHCKQHQGVDATQEKLEPTTGSNYKLSAKSLERLHTTKPELQRLIKRAIEITPIDFVVLEGKRDIQRQKWLVANGKSKTMNSRHLTGDAVDIAPIKNGAVSWDWNDYYPLAKAVKQAAKELNIRVEWGGDWTSFKDGPHWQLPWK
ncbi:Peptidoglycan L-alanyl-D-glutamate endopeptidase CwlK precursor [Psychrobacter pasteurii]|uniref:Peptidoglycan L-alanyl-D-glutamate endopeptidase CwlK n=1 Tax=Psychrobacter pasteurii TaxID=1945520 RepID=A0A1R4EH79_9GAMM|nr:M15 family metallopeptidase [Psychrobacter pasteurii]SJM37803.1 Peptidoglycan L-alanyl-D-glutamate endopeptidase CwlK precursor [Psychrobacter pasteurii]